MEQKIIWIDINWNTCGSIRALEKVDDEDRLVDDTAGELYLLVSSKIINKHRYRSLYKLLRT